MNSPKLEHYVNDVSKVLSESVRHETNERLKNHDTQTTVQSVVYLFPHRQGRELLDIGLEIFNENGIGQKDTNNGLLLIVATEEKKLRIITGKGMEFEWNTEKCQYIVEQILRPLLNAGKYDEMIKAWCDCVEGKRKVPPRKNSDLSIVFFGSILLFLLGALGGSSLRVFIIYDNSIELGFPIFYTLIACAFLWIARKFLVRKWFLYLAFFFLLLGTCISPGFAVKEYVLFSNQCVQIKTCLSTDTTIEKWEKFQAINLAVATKWSDERRKLELEDRRLHPEKYKPSSSRSSSSSSNHSSSSSFGGGGGSSNGGGYGD